MNKVKVSKAVFEKLRYIETNNTNDTFEFKVMKFAYSHFQYWNQFEEWLEKNNITYSTIFDCYKNGYEIEYEFQVGDIVLSKNGNVLEVGSGNPTYKIPQGEINSHKDYFELICKDEDRKDKKSIK